MRRQAFSFARPRREWVSFWSTGVLWMVRSQRAAGREWMKRTFVLGLSSTAPGLRDKMRLPSGGTAHERRHLVALYSQPDRTAAVDGGHPVRRPRGLSAARRRSAAAGRLSDHP